VIRDRAIAIPDDVELVREFLSDLWPASPLGSVWEVRRWEGSVFHGKKPGLAEAQVARSRLWIDEGGTLVAAALSEGGPQIHPHVRPGAPVSTETVVSWAEAAGAAAGDERTVLHVLDGDDEMKRVAIERGYRETDGWETMRSMRAVPLSPPLVPAGYTVRPTRDDPADDEGIATLLNAAFGRAVHHAAEHASLARHASCFLRETDLVAEAEDGSLAAYAAVCWDWPNRLAIFEPVCTHPSHQRHGLARALMLDGMRRAHALGAETIVVGTGDMDPANALYASLPFTAEARGCSWELLTPNPAGMRGF
jgi:mycothiol synthase